MNLKVTCEGSLKCCCEAADFETLSRAELISFGRDPYTKTQMVDFIDSIRYVDFSLEQQ